eukprot:maker-scaffold_17-snap-gene-5.49-mRNA-1 protein AED:0.14 eAED:0.14 QI:0/1/0.5/1/1/1/2/50/949
MTEPNLKTLLKKRFPAKKSLLNDQSDTASILSVETNLSVENKPKKSGKKKKKKNKYYKDQRPGSIVNISPAFSDDESEASSNDLNMRNLEDTPQSGANTGGGKFEKHLAGGVDNKPFVPVENKALSMNLGQDFDAKILTDTQKKILALENRMLNNLKIKTTQREKVTRTKKKVHKKFGTMRFKVAKKPEKKSKKNKRLQRMSKKRIQLLEKPPEIKTPEEILTIKSILSKNVLFSNLNEEDFNKLIYAMHKKEIGSKKVYRAETFFVLFEGELTITENNEQLVSPASFFAESLITKSNSFFTVLNPGSGPAIIYELDGDQHSAIIVTANARRRKEAVKRLEKIPLMQILDSDILQDLVDSFQQVEYKEGDKVIEKGTEGKELYIILSGRVRVTNLGGVMHDLELVTNDYFGEAALIQDEKRAADIIVSSETATFMTLSRDSFEKVLGVNGDAALEFVQRNHKLRILRTIPLFKELEDAELETLLDPKLCEEKLFKGGETILKKGTRSDKMFVLLEGAVKVHTKRRDDEEGEDIVVVKVDEPGDYFGESGLVNELSFADVVIDQEVGAKLLEFDVHSLKSLLDSKKEVRDKVEKAFEIKRMNTLRKEKISLELADLKQMRTLGTGTFGRVRLVCSKKDEEKKTYYALKIISKHKVVQYEQQQNVYNEKNTLLESNHPFILKLYATYKDDTNLYMLMELVQGGELFSLLRKLRKKLDGKWYVACMISALGYLHGKRLIYRDVKPENILIDKHGYAKLVDFGFAKRVKGKTYTMCGTPEYMAPEILLRKGYNKAVDYWAVGVCFFEMCFGYTPFGYNGPDSGGQGNYIEICKNIVRNNFRYPQLNPRVMNRLGSAARLERENQYRARKRLIKGLMKRDTTQRFGMGRDGIKNLQEEEVFEGLDWERLYLRQLEAPWVPSLKSDRDMNYFMKYPEEDEEEEYEDDGTNWDAEF